MDRIQKYYDRIGVFYMKYFYNYRKLKKNLNENIKYLRNKRNFTSTENIS